MRSWRECGCVLGECAVHAGASGAAAGVLPEMPACKACMPWQQAGCSAMRARPRICVCLCACVVCGRKRRPRLMAPRLSALLGAAGTARRGRRFESTVSACRKLCLLVVCVCSHKRCWHERRLRLAEACASFVQAFTKRGRRSCCAVCSLLLVLPCTQVAALELLLKAAAATAAAVSSRCSASAAHACTGVTLLSLCAAGAGA